MIVLNLILADQLQKFKKEVDQQIKNKINKDDAIFDVLRKYILESRNILFEEIITARNGSKKLPGENFPTMALLPKRSRHWFRERPSNSLKRIKC